MYRLTMYLKYGSIIEIVVDEIEETLMEYEAKGLDILSYEVTTITRVS